MLTSTGKFYLTAIVDLYARLVVGWAVSAVNDRHLTIAALAQHRPHSSIGDAAPAEFERRFHDAQVRTAA